MEVVAASAGPLPAFFISVWTFELCVVCCFKTFVAVHYGSGDCVGSAHAAFLGVWSTSLAAQAVPTT